MTFKNLTRIDKFILVIAALDILVIFFPWQFVPYDNSIKTIYSILLHLVWVSVLIYMLFRVRILNNKLKWTFRISTILLVIFGLCNISLYCMFYGLPAEYNSYILYDKYNRKSEKVLYIYYKGFMGGYWDFKKVIDLPSWHFRLETTFDEKKLNGVWNVYDIDNDFEYEKTALFIDGEIRGIIIP